MFNNFATICFQKLFASSEVYEMIKTLNVSTCSVLVCSRILSKNDDCIEDLFRYSTIPRGIQPK